MPKNYPAASTVPDLDRRKKEYTPAQCSIAAHIAALARLKPLCHAVFARPQGWQALGHTKANVLNARRYI